MSAMESYPWNTGAVVIVIVDDDMVEPATMAITPKNDKIGRNGRNRTNEQRFPESRNNFANFFASQSIFLLDIACRHYRMSCTRRGVETEHFTGRSTHAYFSRCAPCCTVVLCSRFIQCTCIGSRLDSSQHVSRVEIQCVCSTVIPPSRVLSQPLGLA